MLQEVACGKEVIVQCGSKSIEWQRLAVAAIVIRRCAMKSGSTRWITSREFTNIEEIAVLRSKVQRRLDNPDEKKPEILSLLNQYREWEATDPRDKIYALLGLSREGDLKSFGFEVDYDRSNEDTYREFARALIKQSASLDLLMSPKGNGKPARRLASWIPDWR